MGSELEDQAVLPETRNVLCLNPQELRNTVVLARKEKRMSSILGQCLRSRLLSLCPPANDLSNPAPMCVAMVVEGEDSTEHTGRKLSPSRFCLVHPSTKELGGDA